MIPIKHIDPDDLALYAMQLLPPDEMEEMRSNLQYSAEARKVLAEYLSDLSIYAHTAEMHSPPAQARQRLMKHVAREKKVVPPSPQEAVAPRDTISPRETAALIEMEPAPRTTGAKVFTWAGWALAAGLAIAMANFYPEYQQLHTRVAADQRQLAQNETNHELLNMALGKEPDAVHARLTSTGTPPPPSGRATYVPAKGALVFVASNLDPLEPAKTYELWVVPRDGADPIPAGTFKPDAHGNASVVMPELPRNVEAAAFAVTIEDDGGSKIPTKPLILQGAAS